MRIFRSGASARHRRSKDAPASRSLPQLGLGCGLLLGGCALVIAASGAGAQNVVRDAWANPPSLVNHSSQPGTVEVTLSPAPTRLSLLPGAATEVYAYNGRIPGPTLEVREGDRVNLRFQNNLPEATTVHWHGLHLPFDADGSPFHPVGPGEEYEYRFTARRSESHWKHSSSSASYLSLGSVPTALPMRIQNGTCSELP